MDAKTALAAYETLERVAEEINDQIFDKRGTEECYVLRRKIEPLLDGMRKLLPYLEKQGLHGAIVGDARSVLDLPGDVISTQFAHYATPGDGARGSNA